MLHQTDNLPHCFFRIFFGRKEKICLFSIREIRHLSLIDPVGIHDNPAGLCLAENAGQADHRNHSGINQIPQYISCTYRWQLVNVSHQNHSHVRRDGFEQ